MLLRAGPLREADRHGEARKYDGAARAEHRLHDGVLHIHATFIDLGSETMDDQQRVVNGEGEANELDHVGDVEHHEKTVSEEVDDAQGARRGRQSDEIRDQDRPTDPEDGDEQQEREDDREKLASMEVARQYRGDVVLESGWSGDEGAGKPVVGEGATQVVGDVGGLAQVERGIDVGVEDTVDGAFLADGTGGDRRRRLRDGPFEALDLSFRGLLERHHDGEGALDVLVELVDQDAVSLG